MTPITYEFYNINTQEDSGHMIKKIRSTIAICILSLAFPLSAAAGTGEEDSKADQGSITIHYTYQNDKQPLNGALFCVIRTAVLSDAGNKSYSLTEPFREMDISDESRISDGSAAAAEEFYRFSVKNRLEPDAAKYTDADGSVYFSSLNQGMYLVYQSGSRSGSAAADYELSAPFMVSIPLQIDENSASVSDIIASPKTVKKASTSTSSDDEKTTSGETKQQEEDQSLEGDQSEDPSGEKDSKNNDDGLKGDPDGDSQKGDPDDGDSGKQDDDPKNPESQNPSTSSGSNDQDPSSIGFTPSGSDNGNNQTGNQGNTGGTSTGSGHSSNGSSTGTGNVETGDHSPVALYSSVAVTAFALLIALFALKRRRDKQLSQRKQGGQSVCSRPRERR